jgi:hypothetical protein
VATAYSSGGGYYPSGSAFVTGSRIAYGIAAAGTLILAIQYARTGVYVTRSQVIVRNVWRTHHIPWEEIDSFAPPGYGSPHNPGLQIRRSDGSVVYATLYAPGRHNQETFAHDVVARLEQLRP